MKKTGVLLVLMLMLCIQSLYAQKQITGTVSSAEDGGTLPGVSVLEVGTSNGAVTDINGKYTLTVKDDATLQFSFVGMQTKTLKVGASNHLNVILQADAVGIEQVVVTAMGIQRSVKSLAYAVENVSAQWYRNRNLMF